MCECLPGYLDVDPSKPGQDCTGITVYFYYLYRKGSKKIHY